MYITIHSLVNPPPCGYDKIRRPTGDEHGDWKPADIDTQYIDVNYLLGK